MDVESHSWLWGYPIMGFADELGLVRYTHTGCNGMLDLGRRLGARLTVS
jgi:hypothetical protein